MVLFKKHLKCTCPSTVGMGLPCPQLNCRDAHTESPGCPFSAPLCNQAPAVCGTLRPRVSLKQKNFLKTRKFLVTKCWDISIFSSKAFSQTQAEDSVFFLTVPWVFQFMTSIQITPELTIFCILNSWLPLNYFSLLFFVIQLFCTTRTWGQDIILIRGALKSLKLSHFVSSFSLKYMRHQPIVRIFCSKYHRVLRWMFFLYFCFLEV